MKPGHMIETKLRSRVGEEAAVEEAAGGVETPPASMRIEIFSLVEMILNTYPHLQPLLGPDPTVGTLKSFLRDYKHEQRLDGALMAQVPLFAQTGLKGGTATPGGKSLRGSRMGSRAPSRVGSTKNAGGGRRGTAASLGVVPEDDVLQQSSRVSSVRSARAGSVGGGAGGLGLAPRCALGLGTWLLRDDVK